LLLPQKSNHWNKSYDHNRVSDLHKNTLHILAFHFLVSTLLNLGHDNNLLQWDLYKFESTEEK